MSVSASNLQAILYTVVEMRFLAPFQATASCPTGLYIAEQMKVPTKPTNLSRREKLVLTV